MSKLAGRVAAWAACVAALGLGSPALAQDAADAKPPVTPETFALRLQATDRTLTSDEVGAVRQRCIDAAEQSLPASLRG